ncbi:hypothetical protein H0H81_008642 [Sphagnurus paluster]|uniref:Uncharacterized protein n=1 Tax=Sphagnurus paluster TaxID=117069 RepID=A0A9P7GMW5_9AGAR|nr:hypothetical protein H0H81_008642 [Sphagnurus paluster]
MQHLFYIPSWAHRTLMVARFLAPPLAALTALSFLLSTVIFIVTLYACTNLSLWLNVLATGALCIHHTVVVTVAWRRALRSAASASKDGSGAGAEAEARAAPHTPYTMKSIAWLLLIDIVYFAALGVKIKETSDEAGRPRAQRITGLGVQLALCVLLGIETMVISFILLHLLEKRTVLLDEETGLVREKPKPDRDSALFSPSPTITTPVNAPADDPFETRHPEHPAARGAPVELPHARPPVDDVVRDAD